MKELGHLFALMVGSRKKYVDPSKAVDILKEAFSSPPGVTDSQQVCYIILSTVKPCYLEVAWTVSSFEDKQTTIAEIKIMAILYLVVNNKIYRHSV